MKIKGVYRMPGSKFFWYRWQENGKRYAVSLKTDDLATAVTKAQEIKDGWAIAHWEQPPVTPVTMATKVVDNYLEKAQARAKKSMRPRTAAKQKAVLVKFLKDTGTTSIRQITLKTCQDWIRGMMKTGASKDTTHTYARVLKTFLLFLAQTGSIRREVANFDIPERSANGRKNWLKLETANDLISKADDPDLRFVLFAGFHTGLRKSEIISAKRNWFDLEAGLLHVQNDPASGFVLKDRENRTIPLSQDFQQFLTGFLAERDSNSYVLRPGHTSVRGEYRTDFKRAIYSHFKRCGVNCSIHDMRRSFASNLVSHGVSIYKVARWLGDGVQVVERSYGHLSPADRDVDVLSSIPSAAISPSIFSATHGVRLVPAGLKTTKKPAARK